MHRGFTIAVLTLALSAGAAFAVTATPVKTGLDFPAAFTFDPAGRIFYAERFTGEIRVYDPATSSDISYFVVTDLEIAGEQGLLGLALIPGYPSRPFLYAYATRNIGGVPKNQILKIREQNGVGTNFKAIWTSNTTAADSHNGGRIAFGPDGMLYALQGEATDPANSQNLGNDAGKILRMNPNGRVPNGNPFPGSRIWAYGIRNSYGFTFDPVNDNLWESENGPACNDEVNLIDEGLNYGWGPTQTCSTPPPAPTNTNRDGPTPVLPKVWFTPTIAPTGIAFCSGCGIASAEGKVFFGAYNEQNIRQSTLDGTRTNITATTIVYTHTTGILSMERGPDGTVYFSDDTGIWKLQN
jgi:glucose/arabinose dehydrogenase